MTREQFLNELSTRLSSVSPQERENVVNYYLEYFEERGVAAGQPVPIDMASPQKIAEEILQDTPFSQTHAGSFESKKFEPIEIENLEDLDVKLNLGGLEIELADVQYPLLKGPKNADGVVMDYEITAEVNGNTLLIRDKFKDNWLRSHKRMNLDPIVLKLPRETKLNSAKIDLKMGSTKVYNLKADQLKLKNNMGSAKLIGGEFGRIEAELDMGSIKFLDTQAKASDLRVSMGDLRGKARLTGQTKINCSMGSVKLELNQERAQTLIQAQVSMGSYRVNGEKNPFTNFQEGFVPESTLELRVSMGSVNLTFTK